MLVKKPTTPNRSRKGRPVKQDEEVDLIPQDDELTLLFGQGINPFTRVIYPPTEVDDGLFVQLDTAISILERQNSSAPITLRLACWGGSVYETFAIIDRLHLSSCPIRTEVYGYAMSAGMLIAVVGATDTRSIAPNATLLFHTMSYGRNNNTHTNQKDYIIQADIELDKICLLMADATKKPYKYWKSLTKDGRDHHFSASQALAFGMVDKILIKPE